MKDKKNQEKISSRQKMFLAFIASFGGVFKKKKNIRIYEFFTSRILLTL